MLGTSHMVHLMRTLHVLYFHFRDEETKAQRIRNDPDISTWQIWVRNLSQHACGPLDIRGLHRKPTICQHSFHRVYADGPIALGPHGEKHWLCTLSSWAQSQTPSLTSPHFSVLRSKDKIVIVPKEQIAAHPQGHCED